jgi:hypothetical protein
LEIRGDCVSGAAGIYHVAAAGDGCNGLHAGVFHAALRCLLRGPSLRDLACGFLLYAARGNG